MKLETAKYGWRKTMTIQKSENDLRTLFSLAEMKALKEADGHLTIMRFTTHWKAMLDTPNLDCGDGRDQVRSLKGYESLEEALTGLIVER